MNKPELTTLDSVTANFARFICAPVDADAAADAIHVLKLSLLDWMAVATAGKDEPVSAIVRETSSADGGTPEATVIGLSARLPARAAAMCNGVTAHALDYDDTHFIFLGHPSAPVIAAALAMAEKTGATGKAFLEAALIGVETACRVGQWTGRAHYQHGFHQTATSGTFGATAAACRLLGLGERQTAHALGLATTKASGLKSQFGTMGKPYHAGLAAANGIEAAQLAAAGFVSRPDGLECDQGFAETHAGEANSEAMDGLGRRYVFTDVQHKFHACCHGTHATLEALAGVDVAPHEIESIKVTVHPRYLKVCNLQEPATGLEAKFSYRLTAAMSLLGHDTTALESFTDELCREAEIVRLRDKVKVLTDEALSETEARVEIHLADTVLSAHHDISMPVPIEDREAKVRKKAVSLLGADRADKVWLAISAIQEKQTLQQLFPRA